MPPAPRTVLMVAALTLAGTSHALALRFEPVDPELLPAGVRSALWARDCGRRFKDARCQPEEEGFSTGDSARLAHALKARRYDEVWLSSGGGVLDEGLGVGEVLRRFQMTVRVPPGHACVSSCTVAFLGGVFRFVDDGATYEVHAGSRFLRATEGDQRLKALVEAPEEELRWWSARLLHGANLRSGRFRGARETAQLLLLHFQKSLHPLGLLPRGLEQSIHSRFRAMLSTTPRLTYPSAQFHEDAARIRREGAAAAQEIVMRLERDAMEQAIDELRVLVPSLGSRAGPALRMLEAMYTSRITMTASLNRQTLVQMGYVTQVFDPAR